MMRILSTAEIMEGMERLTPRDLDGIHILWERDVHPDGSWEETRYNLRGDIVEHRRSPARRSPEPRKVDIHLSLTPLR